eukprot:9429078-Pyramimonas_sp.AAC.1
MSEPRDIISLRRTTRGYATPYASRRGGAAMARRCRSQLRFNARSRNFCGQQSRPRGRRCTWQR